MISLKEFKHIYFIGIKGVGMTPLAILAKQAGIRVTGSDVAEVFVTDKTLERFGITWQEGFSQRNITGHPDLVVVSGAYGGENPEVQNAKERGLKLLTQGQALGVFMEGYEAISVAGSHGKTTTAALLSFLLEKAGLSPTFAVGCGDIPSLSGPANLGRGKYFVAEADEYATCPQIDNTPKFFWQNPKVAVVTNIDWDHPDVFEDLAAVGEAFFQFMKKIPKDGFLVLCLDDPNIESFLLKLSSPYFTYGFHPASDWRVTKVSFQEGQTRFWLEHQKVNLGQFSLGLAGKHNVLNAVAAIAVAVNLGISLEKIRQVLPDFTGTKRRFEFIGQAGGIKLYDDYAHHPTEIAATLRAARQWFGKKRIICLFQPHTYSRTKALFNNFLTCFSEADEVIITEIYASAREKKDPTVSVEQLVNGIRKYTPNVFCLDSCQKIGQFLKSRARPGDIIFTMGAGDIFHYHEEILKNLKS